MINTHSKHHNFLNHNEYENKQIDQTENYQRRSTQEGFKYNLRYPYVYHSWVDLLIIGNTRT